MQVKSFGTDTLIAQINVAVKAANDRGEIIYGISLSQSEYDALRKELDYQGDLLYVPPHGVPVYVDGKHMASEALDRARLLASIGSAPLSKMDMN